MFADESNWVDVDDVFVGLWCSRVAGFGMKLRRMAPFIVVLFLFFLPLDRAEAAAPAVPLADPTGTVLRVYSDMLGRRPDAAGLASYATHLTEGRDEQWLRRILSVSPEFKKRAAARQERRLTHIYLPAGGAALFLCYAWLSRRKGVVVAAAWSALSGATLLYFGLVWRYAVDIPFGDDFDSVLAWGNHPVSHRLLHLADFNNEHRVMVSRLVVELVRLVHGAIDFKLMTLIMNLALVGLLVAVWREGRRWPAVGAWFPLVPLLLFSPQSWFNMIQGTPYALVICLACMAFAAAARLRTWCWIPVALSLAVLATLSMLPGFLIFPLLPVASALRRLDPERAPGATWRSLLTWGWACEVGVLVLAAVLTGLLYFRGYSPPVIAEEAAAPFSILAAIPYTLRFAGAFAGGTLSLAVGSFFCGVLAWATFRREWARCPVFFLLAVFIFLNGAAAAFTRMPMGFSPEDYRYRIFPLTLGVCSIGLLGAFAPRWMAQRSILAMAGGFVVFVYALSFAENLPRLEQRRHEALAGTAAWVQGTGGPCFPRPGRAHAGAILDESIRRGTYRLPAEVMAWPGPRNTAR